jgi:hypothetical protein
VQIRKQCYLDNDAGAANNLPYLPSESILQKAASIIGKARYNQSRHHNIQQNTAEVLGKVQEYSAKKFMSYGERMQKCTNIQKNFLAVDNW